MTLHHRHVLALAGLPVLGGSAFKGQPDNRLPAWAAAHPDEKLSANAGWHPKDVDATAALQPTAPNRLVEQIHPDAGPRRA